MKNNLIPILIVILWILTGYVGANLTLKVDVALLAVFQAQLQFFLACIYFYRKQKAIERRIDLINKKARRTTRSIPKGGPLTEIFEEDE